MKKSLNNRRYSIWIGRRNAKILAIDPEGIKQRFDLFSDHWQREKHDGESTHKNSLFGTTHSREKNDQQRADNYHQNISKKLYPFYQELMHY